MVKAVNTSELDRNTRRAILALNQSVTSLESRVEELEAMDLIKRAEAEILGTYGDTVSVAQKRKSLAKFGRTSTAGTSESTVWRTGGNETLPTTNAIDEIVSTSGSDTGVVFIEGHTISSNELTFVTQSATLTGTSPVTLDTPLARVNRLYIASDNSTDLVGDVTVYENGGDTHLTVKGTLGENQSYKCQTAISNSDYWILTKASGSISEKSAGFVEFELQTKKVNGAWVPRYNFTVSSNGTTSFSDRFDPPIIITKNSDVRITCIADSGTSTEAIARMAGVLAKVTS